jgi:hypothetical protein
MHIKTVLCIQWIQQVLNYVYVFSLNKSIDKHKEELFGLKLLLKSPT